mmetsp:Transcript_24483/g.41666  ORF Transcript_24483/g.41666 Transcript_24483/m.41666 type:complete len:221 (+) Transcript_24483:134-796(+)
MPLSPDRLEFYPHLRGHQYILLIPRGIDQSTEFDHAKGPFQMGDEAESDNQIVSFRAKPLVSLTVSHSPLNFRLLEGKQTQKLFEAIRVVMHLSHIQMYSASQDDFEAFLRHPLLRELSRWAPFQPEHCLCCWDLPFQKRRTQTMDKLNQMMGPVHHLRRRCCHQYLSLPNVRGSFHSPKQMSVATDLSIFYISHVMLHPMIHTTLPTGRPVLPLLESLD